MYIQLKTYRNNKKHTGDLNMPTCQHPSMPLTPHQYSVLPVLVVNPVVMGIAAKEIDVWGLEKDCETVSGAVNLMFPSLEAVQRVTCWPVAS